MVHLVDEMCVNGKSDAKVKQKFALFAQMIKAVRLFWVFTACTFVLLHSMVPHKHLGQVNDEEHLLIHRSAERSPLQLLAYIFHEFTEEGDMERFLSVHAQNVAPAPLCYILPAAIPQFLLDFNFEPDCYSIGYFLPRNDKQKRPIWNALAGFCSVWAMRPPPHSSLC
jgi:hypothetical protein